MSKMKAVQQAKHRTSFLAPAGLSLLEVILAMAIASISIGVLVAIGGTSLRSTAYARDRAMADQFVRQALEQVRAIRDSTGWNALLNTGGSPVPNGQTRIYTLDSAGDLHLKTVADPTADPCGYIQTDDYKITEAPRFYRSIAMKRIATDQLQIDATICYKNQGSGPQLSDSAETLLTDWR